MNKTILLLLLCVLSAAIYANDFDVERKKAGELILAGKYKEGLLLFLKLAQAGDVESQVEIGNFYLRNHDYDGAKKWLGHAAESGNAEAIYYYGGYFLQKTPPEHAKGLSLIKRSAELGYAKAKAFLNQKNNQQPLPKPSNGSYKTEELIGYLSNKFMLNASTNSEFVKCYKLDVNSFKSHFVKINKLCSSEVANESPSAINTRDEMMTLSERYGQCIRATMQKINNVTNEELLNCERSIH